MRIEVADATRGFGELAADEIEMLLRTRPAPVLGVATGSTPLPLYRELATRRHLDFSEATAFGLDEYVGLPPEHPQSYHTFIHEHVTEPLGFDPARVHLPDGTAADPSAESARYDDQIHTSGGIDLQILGIGRNGHIGFNEPLSTFATTTRAVRLRERTRLDNARFFETAEEVPTRAITQGIGTILRAQRLLLLAAGQAKAEVLAQALQGPISASCPASAVQLHGDVVVVADTEAAAGLALIV